MNIIKLNDNSKMLNTYENEASTEDDYFFHRADKNLPRHSFKRVDITPDRVKRDPSQYSNEKVRFSLKKRGFWCKAYIKHTIQYSSEAQATSALNGLSERLGAFIFKKIHIEQYGDEIEAINPISILERVNTSLFNRIINDKEGMEPKQNGAFITFYTPLNFSVNSDINHFLDLKFVQQLQLVAEFDDFNSLRIIGAPPQTHTFPISYNMVLMSDYMTLDNYEDYIKKYNNKETKLLLENNILENGEPQDVITGDNYLRVRSRNLIKKITLSNIDLTQKKEAVEFSNVSLTANNEEIYSAENILESLLFSKNYQGLVSHKVPDATTDGLMNIDFSIPNMRNSFSGGLNMDETHKDGQIKLNSSAPAKMYINYMFYDMVIIKPDGKLEKVDVNNTPYLEEYDYERPKKPEPEIVDMSSAKPNNNKQNL